MSSSAVFTTYRVEEQDIIKFTIADFQRQNLIVVLVPVAVVKSTVSLLQNLLCHYQHIKM